MTKENLEKIHKRMLWVIPGMILAMIGDYCMGVEPKDSTTISGLISSGWLTISDRRIAISNIGGLFGTVFYTLAALPFVDYLKSLIDKCTKTVDKRLIQMYIAGLILGIMSFMYFHLECGTLIHNFNVIYDTANGNMELAVADWNRTYMVQAVPYWITFFSFELAVMIGWIALTVDRKGYMTICVH